MLAISCLLLLLAISWSAVRLRNDLRKRTAWAVLLGLSVAVFLVTLALLWDRADDREPHVTGAIYHRAREYLGY
jgi:multisubunit Na+/H+ antiporter MnhB subunit